MTVIIRASVYTFIIFGGDCTLRLFLYRGWKRELLPDVKCVLHRIPYLNRMRIHLLFCLLRERRQCGIRLRAGFHKRCRLSRNRQRSTTIPHTTSFFCPMWLVCPSPHERRYSVSFIESAGRHLSHLYLARPGEISFPDFMPATRYLSFERTQEFLSHEIRKT